MVSPVRVWLNRTYAGNVFFIDQLRHNPQARPVTVHATHGDPDSPVLAAADTAELEPEGLSPAGYVEFALDQCARRSINVFVPRLHQAALAAHREDFAALGTALVAPPAEASALFLDKATAYETVSTIGIPVPPWWRVRTENELLEAVEVIEAAGGEACLKPASGAGGVGFRIITRAPFSMRQMTGFPSTYVPLNLVIDAMRRSEELVDWLVMPRLDEPEISVDCLTAPDDTVLMAVGRTKNGRRRGFTLRPSSIEPARRIAGTFGLHWLTNIQFRMYEGRPVLMDINTRPAGGLHQLSQCGLNVPWATVRLALGEDPGDLTPAFLGKDYSVVAGPQPLQPVMLPPQRVEAPVVAAAAAAGAGTAVGTTAAAVGVPASVAAGPLA